MTQNLFLSIQTDTMVSVRLDGLIEFLQCLSLEDRNALSRGLGIGINTSRETPDDTVTTETPLPTPPTASDNSPAVTVTSMEVPIPTPSTPTAAAPAIPAASDPTIPTTPAPTAAAPTGHTTILVEFDEYDDSDDEDSAMAAAALADNSILHFYHGTYFNVPAAKAQAPFYCITRGRYIGVFSGWDATGSKVLGISRGIFHKVDSIEKGMNIMKAAIERRDAIQVL
ncbi:uncharacterized protein EDB91DRAFT_1246382 [Suillus paluster]|uniref:uncharacterized protein n=1 Tax=Suillus paluster TaxID=48578 RepID=UPI001B865ACB|nr:uncharacterized protein EDB91DRAFT_1246382 [Suillus paluster]KAG1745509.1 hypothetical protein EDB91DRAFT_1246382 [Suillus paluster]